MDLVSVFCMRYPFYPATFVEEAGSSPVYVFDAFVIYQVGIPTLMCSFCPWPEGVI
jgi:hypothetical protein